MAYWMNIFCGCDHLKLLLIHLISLEMTLCEDNLTSSGIAIVYHTEYTTSTMFISNQGQAVCEETFDCQANLANAVTASD